MNQQQQQPNSSRLPRPEWDRILSASQKNNATEIENLILHHSVSPNHTNAVGQSALHVAALWGNIDAVKTLLRHGADTNAQNRINGATPLHSAVQSMKKPISNRIKCIQLILDEENGCNPNVKDYYGCNALECLRDMMNNGNIGKSGGGGEDEEEWNEYKKMETLLSTQMETLLDNSRNIIFTLIDECNFEQVKTQFKQEMNNDDENSIQKSINQCDLKTGLTPLQFVIDKLLYYCYNVHDEKEVDDDHVKIIQSIKEIIVLLLNHNADISATSSQQNNSQHTASSSLMIAKNNDMQLNIDDPLYDICKLLSSQYNKVNDDGDNQSYMDNHSKIESLLEEIILILLHSGMMLSNRNIQILHDAARRGNLKTVKFWIEKLQVNVNEKGRQGLTPLHFASRSGKVEVVNYLLGLGTVDYTLVDDRGKTALDAAIVNEKNEVMEVLQKFVENKK